MKHPPEDQIQIVVFGPGFGESILMHLGNRNWFIVDSCLNEEGVPVSISFLKNIGVNVTNEVQAVIATHWHKDHTMGLYQTLSECKAAKFVVSATLRNENFNAFLKVHNLNTNSSGSTIGDVEILRCYDEVINNRGESPKFVQQGQEIWVASKGELKHNKPVQILALSPSEFQLYEFLLKIGTEMDFIKGRSNTTPIKKRVVSLDTENDISIATLVTVGEFSILLGADVEMSNNPAFGWNNIVDNYKRRNPKSHVVKVPHHGSESGHSEEMWKYLLKRNPISIITPWYLAGRSLPTLQDLQRVKKLSDSVYLTSTDCLNIVDMESKDLFYQINELDPELYTDFDTCGYVSFLLDSDSGKVIDIQHSGSAKKL